VVISFINDVTSQWAEQFKNFQDLALALAGRVHCVIQLFQSLPWFLAKYVSVRFHASHPQKVPDPNGLLAHREIATMVNMVQVVPNTRAKYSGARPRTIIRKLHLLNSNFLLITDVTFIPSVQFLQ